jgi:hypothetical protein
MISLLRSIRKLSNNFEAVGCLLFLAPVFFLTIRGWVNAISFVLFAICLFRVGSDPIAYFKGRDRVFWLCFVCLILPFISEFFVQVLRWKFVPSSLDGPSRFLIAGLLFVLVSRMDASRLIRLFTFGALLSFPITLSFLLVRFFYSSNSAESLAKWGSRWSMEFADPNTFSSYFAALALLVLGAGLKVERKRIKAVLLCALLALCYFVLIETGSRSGWFGFLFGLFVWGMITFKGIRQKVSFLVLLISSLFFLYHYNGTVGTRFDSALVELKLSPEKTGTGVRGVLLEMDLQMIKMRPLLGWPDGDVPSNFGEIVSSNDNSVIADAKNVKRLAGSHTELTAILTRQGLIFGVLSYFSLFIFPFLIIWVGARRSNQNYNRANYFGIFLFLSSLFVSSWGIQILNLKMFATFYSLVLALLFSARFSEERYVSSR